MFTLENNHQQNVIFGKHALVPTREGSFFSVFLLSSIFSSFRSLISFYYFTDFSLFPSDFCVLFLLSFFFLPLRFYWFIVTNGIYASFSIDFKNQSWLFAILECICAVFRQLWQSWIRDWSATHSTPLQQVVSPLSKFFSQPKSFSRSKLIDPKIRQT